MKIKRTANAGILLELDGKTILVDGVCGNVEPYIASTDEMVLQLSDPWPDCVCYTHTHEDHFRIDYAQDYQNNTLRPIIGPESLPLESCLSAEVDNVKVTWLSSRHLGRSDGIIHGCIRISGSREILVTGDAAPSCLAEYGPKTVDVLICSYSFASTEASWKQVVALAPRDVIILHLPPEEKDDLKLHQAVKATVTKIPVGRVWIPQLGQTVTTL